MRPFGWTFILFLMAGNLSPLPAQTGLARIWALDDGEKVKADDLQHWAKSSPLNPVWDGNAVRLTGGRNEFIAFQVILESSLTGASAVDVRLDSLVGTSATIRNTSAYGDPYDFVGKRIELFLQHYMPVTDRSPWFGAWGWWGSRPLPDSEHTGLIPDALVPVEAMPGERAHGIGGAPFSIAAGRNQGVWVDIYVDRGVPAGSYRGDFQILERGVVSHTIPVLLEVLDFTLPDSTHFKNFADLTEKLVELHGFDFGTVEFWEIYRRYMHLGHRHRMDFSQGSASPGLFRQFLGGYYTGSEYTSARRYEGPGEGIGNTTYSIGTYDQPDWGWGSGFWPNTEPDWQRAANEWEGWFLQNSPSVLRFKYMTDEPLSPAYPTIIERAGWLHRNPGIGRSLKTFCTVPTVPTLRGSIDVWAVGGQSGYEESGTTYGYMIRTADSLRAWGDIVGIYNGTRPSYGQMSALDNFATDCRVTPWIAWKYGVDFYFLWEVGQYATRKNAWVEQYWIADGRKMWGDGQFIYAGEDVQFPEDSRGLRGPIASIRLKNWRRGQQDYEYLWLARERGIDTRAVVDEVVPRAFDDYDGVSYRSQSGQPVWATRGYVFEKARRALGERLQGGRKTALLPSGQITARPDRLPYGGGDVQLSWSTENGSTVYVDGGIGPVGGIGSRTIRVESTTMFTLTVANEAGSVRKSVSVTVDQPPTVRGPHLLQNGTFSQGAAFWTAVLSGGGSMEPCSLSSSRPHVITLKVRSAGTNVQLFQPDVHLEAGCAYRLTFEAVSNRRVGCDVLFLKHTEPYSHYCDAAASVQIDTVWRDLSIDFTTRVLADSVRDGRLMFWFSPGAAAGDEYTFDNIQLQRTSPSGKKDTLAAIPLDFVLEQNYPNPFNPSTIIRFSLFDDVHANIIVYDLLGREVATLADGQFRRGTYQVRFEAEGMAPGVYFYRLRAGDTVETRAMILVK